MDVPEPTWATLREQMSRPALPEAWRRTGVWCIDAVEEVLGPDWPVDAWKRDELPAFIAMPWAHRQAMLEFTEFALRMRILADTPGAAPVRRECRTDRRRARAAGTQLQLEVAGLALTSGASIELEARTPGGYVADVVVDHPDAVLTVECAVVFVPEVERRYDDSFQYAAQALIAIGSRSRWDLTAEVATEDLAGLRADLEDFELALTLSDPQLPVRFDRPWGHVLAFPGEGGLRSVRNTASGTGYGRHLVGKLRGKAAQTAGVDGVWLRADVRSGLWQETAWSQEDLATKAGQLAALVSPVLVDAPWVAGAVLTSGPCIINGDVHTEDAAPVPGVRALRRALPAGRVRETVIVPAHGADARQADLWRSLYDGEPAWLPAALAAHGLGRLDDIFGPGTAPC